MVILLETAQYSFYILFFPFGNRKPHHYHLLLAGHIIAYFQLYFPSPLELRMAIWLSSSQWDVKESNVNSSHIFIKAVSYFPAHDHPITSSGWDEDSAGNHAFTMQIGIIF